VTLAPALNLTGVGQNVFAERYLYLPSAGLCWIAACGWDWLVRWRLAWAQAIAAIVLLLSAGRTWARNREWRDDLTLLEVTVGQSPDACLMRNALAGAYVENDRFERALAEERIAVQCEPRAPVFHKNLGNILLVRDPMAAIPEFEKVVALTPNEPEPHVNLGLALEAAADPARAAAEYEKALKLQPQNREAREGYQRVMRSR
jgi:Flp pilus assembly protein TadD